MSLQKRLFIAVDPDLIITNKISDLITNLKNGFPAKGFRFVSRQNLHLTLLFLGETDVCLIPDISKKLNAVCQKFSEFDLTFKGLGAFPNKRKPRVLWLGVSDPEPVTALANAVIRSAGSTPDSGKSRFSPHLTLARVSDEWRKPSSDVFSGIFSTHGDVSLGTTRVREVILYQSVLQPGGPRYTALSRHSLQKLC